MGLQTLLERFSPAVLVLADGSIFSGYSIGAAGETVGEVVFNTAMTGYQEILTDPSYCEQIVTLTYPHIGNTGTNEVDCESGNVWASGLIIRDLSELVSNWRSTLSLPEYLQKNNLVAIAGLDTRRLTRLLRDKGAQNGCIMQGDNAEQALEKARSYSGLDGKDLAKHVTIAQAKSWTEGTYDLLSQTFKESNASHYHVVAYDFGVKSQILRLLADRNCRITLVPAQTSAEDVLALKPDGVFLSNGPGDPAACDYAIEAVKTLLETEMPVFGICLGFQLLALACGAKTSKMKFGHHGANHPVQNLASGQVHITSQNHGFAVNEVDLPDALSITHRSLFDGTIQGFSHKYKNVFAFQGHPEASPGPHDVEYLFDQFVEKMGA